MVHALSFFNHEILMATYWLNVDTTGTCTLHESDCQYIEDMEATEKKNIGALGPNGGWLPFETAAAAKQHSRLK